MAISLNKLKLNNRKNRPTSCRLFFALLVLVALLGCRETSTTTPPSTYLKYSGKTMGTLYNITFEPHSAAIPQKSIDSILIEINLAVSTYIDTSVISKINQSDKYGREVEILVNGKYVKTHKLRLPPNEHFINNFKIAQHIHLITDGHFDPTVMPLVNYWGFGYTEKVAVSKVDSNKVQSLLATVGLDKFTLEASPVEMICIKPAAAQLDFSASAKGYAVDYLSIYLKEQGVENLLVEIGGEAYAEGLSPSGRKWILGINTPNAKSTVYDFSNRVALDKYALASSGNYRNFHEVDGKTYGHELNPFSGYPELNDILGLSVLAPNCADADAYATALMIMGREKALKFAEYRSDIEAIIFYANEEGNLDFDFTGGYFSHRFLPESRAE